MTAPWTQTVQGGKWDLLTPLTNTVRWQEVGHALSNIARFNGHTKQFYSVAEHCCVVETIVSRQTQDPRARLLALLHDAHEFVLGDMPTPVQHALARIQPGFTEALQDLKARTDEAIFAAAGLTYTDVSEHSKIVRAADAAALMAERAALMAPSPEPWAAHLEAIIPPNVHVRGYMPDTARLVFENALIPLLKAVSKGAK